MAGGSEKSLTLQILLRAGIFLAILAVLAVVIVLPQRNEEARLNQEIAETRAELTRQKRLKPVFAELSNQEKQEVGTPLPMPKLAPVAPDKVDAVSRRIESFAANSGLTVNTVSPTPVSLGDEKAYLNVQATLEGGFLQLRDFLTQLGSLPSLTNVRSVEINSTEGGLTFEVAFTLALAHQ